MLENTFTRVQVLGELSNPDAQLKKINVVCKIVFYVYLSTTI